MKSIAVTKLLSTVIGGVAAVNPVTLIVAGVAGAAGIAVGCFMLASDDEGMPESLDSATEVKKETEGEEVATDLLNNKKTYNREDRIAEKRHKKSIRRAIGKILIIIGGLTLAAVVGTTVIKRLHPLPAVPIQEIISEAPKIQKGAEVLKELEGPINEIKDIVGYSEENVKSFLRKLPAGQHASAMKIQEAAELGIELPVGYTLVDSYKRTRTIFAAA